jgi:hypothetical protein
MLGGSSNLKFLDYISTHAIDTQIPNKASYTLWYTELRRHWVGMCDVFHFAMDPVIGKRLEVLWDLGSGPKKHKV